MREKWCRRPNPVREKVLHGATPPSTEQTHVEFSREALPIRTLLRKHDTSDMNHQPVDQGLHLIKRAKKAGLERAVLRGGETAIPTQDLSHSERGFAAAKS